MLLFPIPYTSDLGLNSAQWGNSFVVISQGFLGKNLQKSTLMVSQKNGAM
jgi:hypothetical protein